MKIAFVGCGYVFDIYMRTRWAHPELEICGVFDIDTARSQTVSRHYGLHAYPSCEALLADPAVEVVVNLTSIRSHADTIRRALEAGKHVYSEKPLTTDLDRTRALFALAQGRGLVLAGAPCNLFSDAVSTIWKAVRDGAIGKPVLVYAELDDNPAHLMGLESVQSPTGAPFPYAPKSSRRAAPSSMPDTTSPGSAPCSGPRPR
jgi:predicted dehydrogenase